MNIRGKDSCLLERGNLRIILSKAARLAEKPDSRRAVNRQPGFRSRTRIEASDLLFF